MNINPLKYCWQLEFGVKEEISQDNKEDLKSKKEEIEKIIMFNFNGVPNHSSGWYIKDNTEENISQLKSKIKEWRDWFESNGYDYKLELAKLTQEDYEEEYFDYIALDYLLTYLGELNKELENTEKSEVSKEEIEDFKRRCNWAENILEEFRADYDRYDLAMEILSTVKGLIWRME